MLRRCIVIANLTVVSTFVLLGFGINTAGAQTGGTATDYFSFPATETTNPTAPTEGTVITGGLQCVPSVLTTCEGVPSGGSFTLSLFPGSASSNALTGFLDLAFNNGSTAATTVTGIAVGSGLSVLSGVIPEYQAFGGVKVRMTVQALTPPTLTPKGEVATLIANFLMGNVPCPEYVCL